MQQAYLAEAKKAGIPITSVCLEILHRNYLKVKTDPLGARWVVGSDSGGQGARGKVILLPFFGNGALKTAEEMDYVGDLLREQAPAAEKAGVILGLEDTISAKDNVRIMERAKSPAVLTYYDVGNSTRNGFDVLSEITWLGKDRICEVHLKDNPNYLGEGTIDFGKVVRLLADIGFADWAQLECDAPSKNVEADMTRNLAFIRGKIHERQPGVTPMQVLLGLDLAPIVAPGVLIFEDVRVLDHDDRMDPPIADTEARVRAAVNLNADIGQVRTMSSGWDRSDESAALVGSAAATCPQGRDPAAHQLAGQHLQLVLAGNATAVRALRSRPGRGGPGDPARRHGRRGVRRHPQGSRQRRGTNHAGGRRRAVREPNVGLRPDDGDGRDEAVLFLLYCPREHAAHALEKALALTASRMLEFSGGRETQRLML